MATTTNTTETKSASPQLPNITLYIHIYNDQAKGIIQSIKFTCYDKIVTVADLTAQLQNTFNEMAKKSNIKYIAQSLQRTMSSKKALQASTKLRTYLENKDDLYMKVATEAIPVATTNPVQNKDLVLSYKTLTTYSFYVASETVVRVIVPVPGIDKVKKEDIIASFTEDSLDVKINHAENGNNYRFAVPRLDAKIIPDKSEAFAKGKDLIIRLKKAKKDDHWSYLFKQKYVGED